MIATLERPRLAAAPAATAPPTPCCPCCRQPSEPDRPGYDCRECVHMGCNPEHDVTHSVHVRCPHCGDDGLVPHLLCPAEWRVWGEHDVECTSCRRGFTFATDADGRYVSPPRTYTEGW